LTKDNQIQISKLPIKISIARIFYSSYLLEESRMGGEGGGGGCTHKWLVTIFVPIILHIPMQLSKVLSFWHLQGDIYYQKKVKQKQSQTKIMHKIF
jgi:hypothetical protein